MINKLIEQIESAIANKLYIVAINTALILPDMCGKAEYPSLRTKDRYTRWCSEYLQPITNKKSNEYNKDLLDLTPGAIYDLRCSMLHAGAQKLRRIKKNSRIINYELICMPLKEYDLYSDTAITEYAIPIIKPIKKNYKIGVCRLCSLICAAAKMYYENNREKLVFDYEIIEKK